ncbi:MAG: tRNA pseudouridine(13) synthase TruD [Candidatus Micrarchaeota archaeon]
MQEYLSKGPGTGGVLKAAPQDFLVEEIAPDGAIYELGRQFSGPETDGPYTHFILQKKNWTSASAISEIALRLRVSQRQFNIAGIKDKVAITTQLASVRGDQRAALGSLPIKDISVNGTWKAGDRVHMGQLLGNRFTITVRDACEGAAGRVEAVSGELDKKMPNYFGEQRFGSSRRNTHLVGRKLLQGGLEDAAIMFLCDISNEADAEAVAARKELADTRDFSRALQYYPARLRLERSLIAYLAKNPGKYAEALRRLPRNILLLFIHAFQSHLFNDLLSRRLSEGALELEEGEYFCGERLGFPDASRAEAEGWICGKIIGYGTPLNAREKDALAEAGIEKEAFRMKALPELASKGTYRTLLAPLKGFSVSSSESGMRFRFELPSGSYATVAMREFTKNG